MSKRHKETFLGERASGVLLHPSSLPGPFEAGDLGPEARRWIDFLASAGQRFWQMLPISPPGYRGSPYSAHSAFAGSEDLISVNDLTEDGLLSPDEIPGMGRRATREELFECAHASFMRRAAAPA